MNLFCSAGGDADEELCPGIRFEGLFVSPLTYG